MKIYVASSWRNDLQPHVVNIFRTYGHEVYDFRDSEGFSWHEIDSEWEQWGFDDYVKGLNHDYAKRGFAKDMAALKWCDACVLVTPCGRSAHLELGWAVGAGKKTVVIITERQEPDLMYAMCDGIVESVGEACNVLSKL